MNELTLNEQESQLLAFLASSDIQSFVLSFDLYHCSNPNTQNTLFLKAAALLSHLSFNNIEGFYKLIQAITIDEISDPNVVIVLKVFDCISRLDFESLKEVSENCPENLKILVENVVKKHLEILENALKQPNNTQEGHIEMDNDSEQIIKDCIFVVKNFIEN